MKKSNKKTTKSKSKEYRNGGDVGDIFRNYGLGIADTALTALGANNIIKDDQYTGVGANTARTASNVIGGLGKTALPIAANIIAPGSGQFVSMGQNIVSKMNPQDPDQQYKNGGCMECGGQMENGGLANSELEKQENVILPNGGFIQFNGKSHDQGGIPTNLPNGSIVFSDKLKASTGKTFAKENMKNNTNKEDKILSSNKSSQLAKKTAELMKSAKQKNSENLFNEQESLKQSKIDKYIKRLGGTITNEGSNIELPHQDQIEQGILMSGEEEFKNGGWIQKAINPKHKGYCTPMTKSTCTPHRKALAMTFKKHHGFHKKEDGGIIQYPDGGKVIKDDIRYTTDNPFNPGVNYDIIQGLDKQARVSYKKWLSDIDKTGMTIDEYYKKYPSEQDYIRKSKSKHQPYIPQFPDGGKIKLPSTLTSSLTHYLTPGQVPYKPQDLVKYGYNPIDKEGSQYEDSKGNIYIYKPIKYNEEGWNNPQNPYSKNQPKGVWKGQKGILEDGGEFNTPYNPDYQSINGPINPNYIPSVTPDLNESLSVNAAPSLDYSNPYYNNSEVPIFNNTENNISSPKVNKSPLDYKSLGRNVLYGAANNAGYLYDLYRSKDLEQEQFNPMNPKYLDPTEALRDADMESRKSVKDLSNIADRSSYLGARIAQSTANTLNKAKIRNEYENQNVGISNQFTQANKELDWRTRVYNAMNRAQQRNIKSNAIGNIGQNVARQSNDVRLGNLDKEKVNMIPQMYQAVLNDPEFLQYLTKFGYKK